MKYLRSIVIGCDAKCGVSGVVTDGDEVQRIDYSTRERRTGVIGAFHSPISLADAVTVLISRGWVAMSPREANGNFRQFKGSDVIERLPRHAVIVCPNCAGRFEPPYSVSATHEIESAEGVQRALLHEVQALRAEVARLASISPADSATDAVSAGVSLSRSHAA